MAASEMAVSLAMLRLLDLLSKSKDIITNPKLRDQIPDFISNVQTILSTREHIGLHDVHSRETQEGGSQLSDCARNAEEAEAFLVGLLQDQTSGSQEGRFANVFALVRLWLFSVTRARASKKMANDFMMKVRLLRSAFESSQPPANEGMPDNARASSSSSSKRNQEYTRQRVESYIVPRKRYVEDLVALLIDHKNDDDSNLRVISVVGEHACGKTALVRSVFSRLKIKQHFDCCTWVSVTSPGEKSDRMKNVLVDILRQTPLRDQVKDLERKQEEQLFEMLHKSLMGLRYLIVLDDLREPSLINELLVPFVDSMNGSRVIVTTPIAEMQNFADPWMPDLRLDPDMTDEESKVLLQVSIMGDHQSGSEMTTPEKILSKCNHSPPAISLLGGLLSAVEKSNWDALINRLGERPTLDDIMRLSFDELPHMIKRCVLYMALFPEESEVPIRRLFRLWAAEGLLAGAADRSVQMPSAQDCFCELESRNLIRVVRRKVDGSACSCRVPAFIHEFFYQKAKELVLLHRQCSSVFDDNQSAHYQQKQAHNTATGHYGYKVRCFQSFALFNTRKLGSKVKITVLLESLISNERLILLRVLDLEGVYKPVLPQNFGNTLPNLRYLGLRWTVLDSIPESVGNLLLLETLDLKHTNITEVASSIWNAKNLRHLYLSNSSFDKSLPHPIPPDKSKLETLWGLFIETPGSPMIGVLRKLQSLKKLGVTCRPGAVEVVTDCVLQLSKLESLRLRSRDLYGQPLQALRLSSRDPFGHHASLDLGIMTKPNFLWPKSLSNLYLIGSLKLRSIQDLSVLPGNLKVLTLSLSELEGDLMQVLQRLKDLVVLRLLARSYTGQRLVCDEDGFPKLRVLKLWMLEELGQLIVKKGGLVNLEVLEIRQCQNLCLVSDLDHIDRLKSVSLTGVRIWPFEVPKQLKPCRTVYGH